MTTNESTLSKETVESPLPQETVVEAETKVFVASQWKLMWWRFKKHKLAYFSLYLVIAFYVISIFAGFFSPYAPDTFNRRYVFMPPQSVHFVDSEGNFHLRPFVYGIRMKRDPETLRPYFTERTDQKFPIYFFVRGDKYKFWNLFETDLHLFGLGKDAAKKRAGLFLLGTDRLGRDMLTRTIYGARISLSVGLIGVALSLFIGIVMGGISGFRGGLIDDAIQRLIELLRAIPTIPLWMGLAAALPASWPPLRVYFLITVILSAIGWTEIAREVRGKLLALREEDFVMAARFTGVSEIRIILSHMVPSFFSHLIATLTLAIPSMILAETSLSFLGLGLRSPVISWGVLLKDAQNLRTIALSPWLLMPGVFLVIFVLAMNFMGDGLRDAADPYKR